MHVLYDTGINMLKDNTLPVFPSFLFYFLRMEKDRGGVERGADFISILIYAILIYNDVTWSLEAN